MKIITDRKFIETIPKLGYRFIADVSVTEIIHEEIEISLENKTKISAEGNFSSEELAEVIRTTAESLEIDQNQIKPHIKQIDSGSSTGLFQKIPNFAIFAIGILAVLITSVGIWFWKNSDDSRNSSVKFDVANITIKRLTNSGKAWHPAISPDGRYIAYVHHEGNYKDGLRLKNLGSGSVTEVVSATNAEFGSPVFFG